MAPARKTAFKIADHAVNGEQYPRLLADNSTSDQFQFYECFNAGSKFEKSSSQKALGQVRSTSKSGHCVTAACPWTSPSDNQHHEKDTEKCAVKIQPCATKDSEELRGQWFSMPKGGFGVQYSPLVHEGYSSDEALPVLEFQKDYAVFLYTKENDSYSPRPYLSNKADL
ncbi:hypothetical protein MOBT1_002772 [Malassezia obtusa]|uniref:Uncharacterized protein n=1 Tax=Malassezia obtusa TaxID=76774 RepID=A0AAF0E0K5_9BASI|nr:hypothetical protein MOBT1_002772 [Malassezia obtusa]